MPTGIAISGSDADDDRGADDRVGDPAAAEVRRVLGEEVEVDSAADALDRDAADHEHQHRHREQGRDPRHDLHDAIHGVAPPQVAARSSSGWVSADRSPVGLVAAAGRRARDPRDAVEDNRQQQEQGSGQGRRARPSQGRSLPGTGRRSGRRLDQPGGRGWRGRWALLPITCGYRDRLADPPAEAEHHGGDDAGTRVGQHHRLIISQRVPPRAQRPSFGGRRNRGEISRVRLETIGTVMIVRITTAVKGRRARMLAEQAADQGDRSRARCGAPARRGRGGRVRGR